ncbi:FtsK/SpoIIIE domain-containing protein [Jiangella rhizosphaerae]|nr:FtsK/SpoIIIE domain-containing protein [Jiangella rhizosphaerae]
MTAPVTTITPGQAATFAKGLRDRDSWPRQLLAWFLVVLAILTVLPGLVLLLWKFPALVGSLLVGVAAVLTTWYFLAADWILVAAAVVAPAGLLALWRHLHRASFAPVGARLLGGVRATFLYRPRWRRHTIACGLATKDRNGDPVIPRLVRVISRYGRDELRVRLLPGQTPDDWRDHVVQLAHAYRVGGSHPEYIDRVTARTVKSGTVTLVFPRADKLAAPVPRFAPLPVEQIDFERLPVARREDGLAYRLQVLYTHVLVAGASGSGKGSVLWSIVAALAPAIPTRLVRLWGIDPKGGMELTMGRMLFDRLAWDNGRDGIAEAKAEELVTLMEDLAALVRERTGDLAGRTRKLAPSTEHPFIVCIVDELAFLTAYMPYKTLKTRFDSALTTVLSQGRAVGVTVVALLQDPRKETVPQRNLFPVKVGLRLDSEEESKMVLGKKAWERGALCESIPMSTPGVAFVLIDGQPTPWRVRFTHITDDDVRDLAWNYTTPPPPPPAVEPATPALAAVPDPDDHDAAETPAVAA